MLDLFTRPFYAFFTFIIAVVAIAFLSVIAMIVIPISAAVLAFIENTLPWRVPTPTGQDFIGYEGGPSARR